MTNFKPRILLLALVVFAVSACTDEAPVGPASAPVPSTAPTAMPTPSPVAVLPSPSPSDAPVDPTAAPRASDLPSRVVIPDLSIDLPIVSGDLAVAGNPPDYPLCDVAQFLTTYRFPGRLGTTTWVYAHAREGMFLPLLEASERQDGQELIGMTVDVYSDGPMRYTYEITEVARHATDRGIARDVPADSGRLILQTSEGPTGTIPKLQIAARLVDSGPASQAEAVPPARPRVCAG